LFIVFFIPNALNYVKKKIESCESQLINRDPKIVLHLHKVVCRKEQQQKKRLIIIIIII